MPHTYEPPRPFGYKTTWLCIASRDPRAVADALHMQDLRTVPWKDGAKAAYTDFLHSVYVTPSVNGWVFAINFPPGETTGNVATLLNRLSTQFGEAQAYINVRTASCYMWARSKNGVLTRAFYYADGTFQINHGDRTSEELDLGIGLVDDKDRPHEEDVLQIAERWSINPLKLGDQQTHGTGWLGRR